MCDFDGGLLVHLAHGCHFNARLDDVVRRAVAVKQCIFVRSELPRLRVGGDGSEVGIAAASSAAGELVVGAVVAGFGVDDQVAAGEGVQDNVDKAGASDNGALRQSVTAGLLRRIICKCCQRVDSPAQQKKVIEGVLPFAVAMRPAARGRERTM